MRFFTHLSFALLLSLLFVYFLKIEEKVFFIGVVLLFSLLPDIDESHSYIGKRMKLLSLPLHFIFGHRTIFHSFFIPFLIFIALYFVNWYIALAAFIGYISHLILDMMTLSGIAIFYPFSEWKIRGFVRTDSFFDYFLFLLFLLGSVWLLWQILY